MFYTLTWLLIAVLLTLWSGAAWALHALLGWSGLQAGGLAGLPDHAAALGAPAWLTLWLPAELQPYWTAALAALGPFFDYLLAIAPGLVAWAGPVVWGLWALGGVVLLVLGVVATLMIRTFKRRFSLAPRRALSPTAA